MTGIRKAGRGHIVVQDVRAAEADVRCRFLMTEEGHQCPAAAAAPDRGILLCVTHLVPIERFLRAFLMITEEPNVPIDQYLLDSDARRQREQAMAAQSVVYYVRIGNQCKIGTTRNMTARMKSFIPDEVLATEPGSYELEQARHQQFAHLRQKGERFDYRDELVDHVAMIRRHHGAPTITKALPT